MPMSAPQDQASMQDVELGETIRQTSHSVQSQQPSGNPAMGMSLRLVFPRGSTISPLTEFLH